MSKTIIPFVMTALFSANAMAATITGTVKSDSTPFPGASVCIKADLSNLDKDIQSTLEADPRNREILDRTMNDLKEWLASHGIDASGYSSAELVKMAVELYSSLPGEKQCTISGMDGKFFFGDEYLGGTFIVTVEFVGTETQWIKVDIGEREYRRIDLGVITLKDKQQQPKRRKTN